MGARRDLQREFKRIEALLGPPFDPNKARLRAINLYSSPEVRAAAWAESRDYGYDAIQDKNGVYVTESEWHSNREDARLNKLQRLDRSVAMKVLRQAIAIGGNEGRRKCAWRKLRDHRVVLKSFDSGTIITEEVWRQWVAEGKFCHDPRGCILTGVDEDYD